MNDPNERILSKLPYGKDPNKKSPWFEQEKKSHKMTLGGNIP